MQISLKHNNHTLPQRVETFYDGGLAVAIDGVLTLDSSDITHLQAAYFRGYNMTLEGERLYGFTDLDRYIAAKSAGEGREPRKKSTVRRG